MHHVNLPPHTVSAILAEVDILSVGLLEPPEIEEIDLNLVRVPTAEELRNADSLTGLGILTEEDERALL